MESREQILKAANLLNDALARQFCNLTFSEFCKATGMVEIPGDDYAMNKWQNFQGLVKNWGAFDVATLANILSYDPEITEPETETPNMPKWKIYKVTGEVANMELKGVFNGTRRELVNHCYEAYREHFGSSHRTDLDHQTINDGTNDSVRVFPAGVMSPVDYIHAVKVGEF